MLSNKGVLIDTNVLIYLSKKENTTFKKDIVEKIAELAKHNIPLYYNLTIFKEYSVGIGDFQSIKKHFLKIKVTLKRENILIMYRASEVYREYLMDFKKLKENTEELIFKSKTIPNDCIIGATAEYYDLAIITNNGKDFRKYFPNVDLIEI